MSEIDDLLAQTSKTLEQVTRSVREPNRSDVTSPEPTVNPEPEAKREEPMTNVVHPQYQQYPPQSRQSGLLIPAFVLGCFILAAAYLFTRHPHAPHPPSPDDNTPKPVAAEVIEGFDEAATTFFAGLGGDIEVLGERVRQGEITTVTQWQEESRDLYTKWDDEFIRMTGEWDNKYVPQKDDKDVENMSEMQRKLLSSSKLTDAEREVLAAYTIASGQGLKQAVSK